MDRINVTALNPTNPLATLSPGSRRGWQDQDLTSGTPGTIPNQLFLNPLQEELLALIEGVGLTPSGTAMAQVLQGLKRLFGGNYTYVTASTTLTADNIGLVVVNATAGNVVLTLPAGAAIAGTVAGAGVTNPYSLRIYRNDTSANTVTVETAGSDTISSPGGVVSSLLVPSLGTWELFSGGGPNFIARLLGPQPRGSAFSNTAGTWNWTCPAGVFFAKAKAWDAGAGGGYGASGNWGHGGGGGGYFEGVIPVVPGNVYGSTVGVGGVAGTSGSINGASPAYSTVLLFNGGQVYFGSAGATAAQGGPGNAGIGGAGGSAPAVSGLAAGSFMAIGGAGGTTGASVSPYYGGSGGASFGGSTSSAFLVGATAASGLPGVGGNGGANASVNAAAGQNGAIYLEW